VPDQRRAVDRTPISGEVVGEVTVFQPMTILDMSECGAKIEAPYKLQNDSLHEFRLSLGDQSVVVKGRVVYCQIGDIREGTVLYRTGVEFVEPPPHVLAAIRDFVAARKTPPPPVIDAETA
jgi:hypothetical protein